jgi:hypothetical protein
MKPSPRAAIFTRLEIGSNDRVEVVTERGRRQLTNLPSPCRPASAAKTLLLALRNAVHRRQRED